MRKFNPVTETSTCHTCGTEVQPSPAEGYSRQTVVSSDDCETARTYCSNQCVNADAAELSKVWDTERRAVCAHIGHRPHLFDATEDQPALRVCSRCEERLPVGTPEQLAKAARLRSEARENLRQREESWERSDTDGFLSQWASGCMARLRETQAELLEAGEVSEFPALFDLDGNMVAAKLINTRFGLAWALLDSDDPSSRFVGFVNASKASTAAKRNSYLAKKGYQVGTVRARAKAELSDGISPVPCVVRADGGFDRNAEIVNLNWDSDTE